MLKSNFLELVLQNWKSRNKGAETVMGGQVLDYEAKRIAREAAKEAAIKAEKTTTKKKDLEAVKNMISFGVSEEKILSKYPKSVYEEALKLVEQENNEPKEM